MPNIDDQIRVYHAIYNMRLKALVTICILIGFFIILFFVCCAKTLADRAVFAALDSILAGTMYPMTKHFFPAIKEAMAAEKRETKGKK